VSKIASLAVLLNRFSQCFTRFFFSLEVLKFVDLCVEFCRFERYLQCFLVVLVSFSL
jgi:hypothetical protein